MKTINATVSINKAQLRDDVVETALQNGFTMKDIETLEKREAYRKEYNTRPVVVAKRAMYMKRRYEKMKALKSLLRSSL